jgi:thiamine pyrophosphokinase
MSSTFEKLFDNMPDDIKDMVYEKVLYTQPKELLAEIRKRDTFYSMLVYLECEKKVKPTIEGLKYALKNHVTSLKKLKKLIKLLNQQKNRLSL